LRILLFVVAFVIALAASAPLERWVLPLVRKPLADAGLELRVDGLRLAFPAGLRATGLTIEGPGADANVESLYVGLLRDFDAEACGGRLWGTFTRHSVDVRLAGVSPAGCVRIGKLSLDTPLSGSLNMSGVHLLDPRSTAPVEGHLDLSAPSGVFRGILEGAGREGADLPLGEWEFQDLSLKAHLADGKLLVDEGRTNTSGVEWEVLSVDLPRPGDRGGLRVDFRARVAQDGPRAKALIGLMPKTAEDGSGWHNYRVVGSLSAPRLIGVD
jgi:type II secretion system protein N